VGDCQRGTIERTEPVRPALGARCVGARTPRPRGLAFRAL